MESQQKEYKLNPATINDILQNIPLDRLDDFLIDFNLYLKEAAQKAKDNPNYEVESLELVWVDDNCNDINIEWKEYTEEVKQESK